MFDPETGAFAANMAMRKLAESGQVGYTETKVIFPTTELELTHDAGGSVVFWASETAPFVLTAGQTYRVVWNGVKYECVANVLETPDSITAYYIGNLGFEGGPDTGEPFFVIHATENGMSQVAVYAMETTATLSISTETVHTIDPKYLPGPPHFDLREMGLPTLSLDGNLVFAQCDTTELLNAMKTNVVSLILNVNVGNGNVVPVEVVATTSYLKEDGTAEATCMAVFGGAPLLLVVFGSAGLLQAQISTIATIATM